MAFFDFDRRIQTLLIAGAIATVGGCSCGSQAVDPAIDIFEAVDPAVDIIDMTDTDEDIPGEEIFPDAVDPAPDVIDMTEDDPDEDDDPPDDAVEASLSPHGFIRTTLSYTPDADGGIHLFVRAGASSPEITWIASAGTLEADGDSAFWRLPRKAGIHAVQVTVRSGERLGIETLKITL
jgi:hypothetical protein